MLLLEEPGRRVLRGDTSMSQMYLYASCTQLRAAASPLFLPWSPKLHARAPRIPLPCIPLFSLIPAMLLVDQNPPGELSVPEPHSCRATAPPHLLQWPVVGSGRGLQGLQARALWASQTVMALWFFIGNTYDKDPFNPSCFIMVLRFCDSLSEWELAVGGYLQAIERAMSAHGAGSEIPSLRRFSFSFILKKWGPEQGQKNVYLV